MILLTRATSTPLPEAQRSLQVRHAGASITSHGLSLLSLRSSSKSVAAGNLAFRFCAIEVPNNAKALGCPRSLQSHHDAAPQKHDSCRRSHRPHAAWHECQPAKRGLGFNSTESLRQKRAETRITTDEDCETASYQRLLINLCTTHCHEFCQASLTPHHYSHRQTPPKKRWSQERKPGPVQSHAVGPSRPNKRRVHPVLSSMASSCMCFWPTGHGGPKALAKLRPRTPSLQLGGLSG